MTATETGAAPTTGVRHTLTRGDQQLDIVDPRPPDARPRRGGGSRRQAAKSTGEFALSLAAVLLYLFFFDPRSVDTLSVLQAFLFIGQYLNLAVHALLIGMSVCGLVVCLLLRSVWLRSVSVALVFALLLFGIGFHAVFRSNIQLTDLDVLWSGQNFIADALITYSTAYLRSIGWALAAGLGLLLLPSVVALRFPPRALVVPFSALLACALVLYETAGVFAFVPTPYALPILLGFSLTDPSYKGPRDTLTLRSTQPGLAKHFVLLMDESIRGDMLSINGHARETTPYLSSLGGDIINVGIASSASNCSEYAHLIVRTGLGPGEIPDVDRRSLRKPDLVQFARNAGFRTYFLDGQWRQGKLHSFMRRADLDHLDGFFQTEGVECSTSGDCEVLEKIVQIMTSNVRSFTYAVKRGVHVHYESSYPPGQRMFQPTLGAYEPMQDRERALNSYSNGIRWNVDRFFQALLPRIAGQDYIILYTSDHGQHILETPSPLTHCQVDAPAAVQANVPMVVMAGRRETRAMLARMLRDRRDRTSHFEIFPTLLVLFGYRKEYVNREFGATLFDATGPRRFYSGDVFGRRSGGGWSRSDGKLLGMGRPGGWWMFDTEGEDGADRAEARPDYRVPLAAGLARWPAADPGPARRTRDRLEAARR
jgi:hypothetical protein